MCGLFCSGEASFDAPARDTTSLSIAGRNGNIIFDNGKYKNITIKYPSFFLGDFTTNVAKAREWLLSPLSYQRLTDDYNTGEFRLAIYSGGLEFEPTAWNKHAKVDIEFNCKPQRFLTSGETATAVASGGSITNPTNFEALPLITITGTGSGTITVNGTTVTLSDLAGGIVLDCELKDAYYGLLPANNLMSGDFPTLGAGANTVTYTGGITAVSITPRWWRI